MKRRILATAALAVLAASILASGNPSLHVNAGSPPTLLATSARAVVGERATVEVRVRDIPEPGLGAWDFFVTFDPDVVRSVDCLGMNGTVCGRLFSADTDRFAGASAEALVGDATLVIITYECGEIPGTTAMTLTYDAFGIPGTGKPPLEPEIENGAIACVEPRTPTSTPTLEPATPPATPTTSVLLPPTGTGGSTVGDVAWPIDALAAVGVVAISLASLQIRRRR